MLLARNICWRVKEIRSGLPGGYRDTRICLVGSDTYSQTVRQSSSKRKNIHMENKFGGHIRDLGMVI